MAALEIIYYVVMIALVVYAITQIPDPKDRPPAAFSDLELPVAEVGMEIPVLFGTRDLDGPNVVWYGDMSTVAVKA